MTGAIVAMTIGLPQHGLPASMTLGQVMLALVLLILLGAMRRLRSRLESQGG